MEHCTVARFVLGRVTYFYIMLSVNNLNDVTVKDQIKHELQK